MIKPVLKAASYILVHTPDMVWNGTTQTTEMTVNPNSEYLQKLETHLRTFEQAVTYPPNQTYIGQITPAELKKIEFPWYDKKVPNAERYGTWGEIMPQDEFIALIKIVDSFDLVKLHCEFAKEITQKIVQHPCLKGLESRIGVGVELSTIREAITHEHAQPLYHNKCLVGYVQRAHDLDVNLNAHIIFENLVSKASAVLALKNLALKNNFDLTLIDYVIECSEEACGDMNQRGGGNFAKSIAEIAGATKSTGSDTRGFCAAPAHALILAASLVKAGTFKNIAIVAGGATAKLGMNGKDHVKKGLPIIEDMIGGFATLVSENDFQSPVFNTDLVGKHEVGTGSSPQAVITALVASPLFKGGLKITDIDKFSVEMQNPDITKPAGAGDVPEANYKMIAALAVMKNEIERNAITNFIEKHGMPGWAPTQGHIPSGVPYLGFAIHDLTIGSFHKVMIVGKGSLFLGRMTNLFDGVSIVLERNPGSQAPVEQIKPSQLASSKVKIGLTLLGSEHGINNIVKGAEIASKDNNFDVVLIGPKVKTNLEIIEVSNEKQISMKMEELLDNNYIQGCVTMHYSFPIGVSTVGRVITPALGKELLIATTTGTSDTERVLAMVKNTIHGVITAKALGILEPTVGILNLDGARAVERKLHELTLKGYKINLAQSGRADRGSIMRGNDLLNPNFDILVTDTLTGNILMKMFSAYTTGGNYEAMGFGYGPGIGDCYQRLVIIISRASGIPVVANSLIYAAQLTKGKVFQIGQQEYQKAKNAGLESILQGTEHFSPSSLPQNIPFKEVVTHEITGIEIFDLENAVNLLHSKGIYAESGMGCTGPVILINENKKPAAEIALKEGKFIL